MRTLVGMGVAFGVALAVVGCSSSNDGSEAAARVQPGSVRQQGVITGSALSYAEGDPDRPVIAGKVTAFSLFADGSGGVGVIEVPSNVGYLNFFNMGLFKVTPDNPPVDAGGSHNATYPISIPSDPSWTGELHVHVDADGTVQASVVQLVTLIGQDTVGAYTSQHGTPWVSMAPSSTFLCMTDADCTLYGLDTANGAYTCVQNTCTQAFQPPPCPPSSDITCL